MEFWLMLRVVEKVARGRDMLDEVLWEGGWREDLGGDEDWGMAVSEKSE